MQDIRICLFRCFESSLSCLWAFSSKSFQNIRYYMYKITGFTPGNGCIKSCIEAIWIICSWSYSDNNKSIIKNHKETKTRCVVHYFDHRRFHTPKPIGIIVMLWKSVLNCFLTKLKVYLSLRMVQSSPPRHTSINMYTYFLSRNVRYNLKEIQITFEVH